MKINYKNKFFSIIKNLDGIFAIIGLILAIVLIIYLFSSKYYLNISRFLYMSPAIIIILSCVSWLIIRRKKSVNLSLMYSENSIYLIASSLFFLFLTLSSLSIYLSPDLYIRPIVFFIFISIMAGLITLEIFFLPLDKKYSYFTLFQIVIIGLTLVISQLMIFPNVVGVDPWWHQMLTSKILVLGHIPQDYSYSKIPAFHLFIAFVSIVTGLNYKLSMISSVCFLQVLIDSLIIFILGRRLFDNKVGLYAALLLSTANINLNFGFWTIPNTLGGVLTLLLIFIIVRYENDFRSSLMVIILSFALIITHALASMNLAIILFAMFFIYIFYNQFYKNVKIPLSLTIAVLFSVMMFTWWVYVSNNIQNLADLLSMGFTIENSVPRIPAEVSGYLLRLPILEQILNSLGLFLFFGLAICGFFYMISQKYSNKNMYVLAFVGILTLTIGYLPYISGFSLLENRWWYIAQILLSIPLAVTIFLFTDFFRKKWYKSIFITLFTILFCFLMITSVMANLDNHFLSPNSAGRSAFTTSEISSMGTLSEVYPGLISADWASHSPIEFYYEHKFKSIDKSIITGNYSGEHGLILIRQQIIKSPFSSTYGTMKLENNPLKILTEKGFSKIYSSGSVDGFYQR